MAATPPAGRRPRLLPPLLAAFCFVLPAAAVLLPHWPPAFLWGFGLALPVVARLELGQRPWPEPALLLALLPLLLWALLSSLWSFDAAGAATLALRSFASLAVGLLLIDCFGRLPPAVAARALRWLLPGFALGALLLVEELASGLYLRELIGNTSFDGPREADHLNRSAVGLMLLSFAAACQARRVAAAPLAAGWAGWALLGLLFAVLLLFPSSTALLALGLGMALLAIALPAPEAGRRLLLALLVLALPLMPLLAAAASALQLADLEQLGITARARAHVWSFTLERILERPLFGWGLDAAPNMPNFGVAPFFHYETKVIPLHPHSAGLQLWLDLGLVGVLLAQLPLLLAWRRLRHASVEGSACAIALAGALLAAGGLSFGLWQSRWIGLVLLALALLRLARRAGEPP